MMIDKEWSSFNKAFGVRKWDVSQWGLGLLHKYTKSLLLQHGYMYFQSWLVIVKDVGANIPLIAWYFNLINEYFEC